MDEQEFTLNYGKLVARTWRDPEFLARLKSDPVAALREFGIEVPPDAKVRVVVMEPTGQGTAGEQWEIWQRGQETGTYDLFIPTRPADLPAQGPGDMVTEGTYCCSCTPCCCCT